MDIPLIIRLSFFSTFLPFFACLFYLKDFYKIRRQWLFFIFITCTLLTELSMTFLAHQKISNIWIFHIYTVIEFLLVMVILNRWQNPGYLKEKLVLAIPVFVIIYILLKAFSIENIDQTTHNYISRPLALIFINTSVFYTFHSLNKREAGIFIYDFRFWILFSMAIYYSGSLILFPFMYIEDRQILTILFQFHAGLNIIHNLLFVVGISKIKDFHILMAEHSQQ